MEEIQIQVRNLSGESTIVSISPSKTVADLKLLLSASFPSASSSSSPNFHLFLKVGLHEPKATLEALSLSWDPSGKFDTALASELDRPKATLEAWRKNSVG